MPIENILLWVAVLTLVSVLASKFSDRFAIPALLLFLAIGMLAGSEGFGGIHFNDPWHAKTLGIIALIFIIFSGGIDTNWKDVRPVILPGIMLSTAGVIITAIVVGLFAVRILKFSFLEGLLLGSIVSSTDAAAVFNILRSRRISLKSPLKPLLELESGSNDPVAVFLTISFISLLTIKNMSIVTLIPKFVLDMGGGAFVGYLMAKLSIWTINRLKLESDGLYPVLTISLVLLTYSLAVIFGCNGFLAVYLAGLFMGKHEFFNKRMIVRFHDGLAWLMQIAMFLTLGLLVFPSRILPVMGVSLCLALVLMLFARPIGVFLCLLPFRMTFGKKAMVAWVGLRGAVPIILATFPLLAGIPKADIIFNVVFFVVATSVLIQGTSITFISKLLKVDTLFAAKRRYPIEFEKTEGVDAELTDLIVPYNSEAAGKRIKDLNIPEKCLIMLISRGERFIIPAGPTMIQGGDVLLVLANKEDLSFFQQTLAQYTKE
ncbi:MAG: potassium/proton antiporter [Candidatus Omnitrophica bacterium]|nr:potassium/proton antiporter [Candidatus Omnitrophota bacterium]